MENLSSQLATRVSNVGYSDGAVEYNVQESLRGDEKPPEVLILPNTQHNLHYLHFRSAAGRHLNQ